MLNFGPSKSYSTWFKNKSRIIQKHYLGKSWKLEKTNVLKLMETTRAGKSWKRALYILQYRNFVASFTYRNWQPKRQGRISGGLKLAGEARAASTQRSMQTNHSCSKATSGGLRNQGCADLCQASYQRNEGAPCEGGWPIQSWLLSH